MSPPSQQLNHLLSTIRAGLPALPEADPHRIDVARVLTRLADAKQDSPEGQDEKDTEMLCRKIAVTGNVLQTYDPHWKNPQDDQRLALCYWPLLIAVLLTRSERNETMTEHQRGRALKCLNAAMNAIDIAEGIGGVEHLTELKVYAHAIIEDVSCEVNG